MVTAPGGPGSPLVGIATGRSLGGSVQRNRAKRRLREAVAQAPLRRDRDYVVVAGREVLEVPFQEVVAWIGRALEEQARGTCDD